MSLFVSDEPTDEIVIKKEIIEEDVDEDDPIVESIPLYMNALPERTKQSLHVLQYPGRPKSRPNTAACQTSIKPNSNYLQIKIPSDTSQFLILISSKTGVNRLHTKLSWGCWTVPMKWEIISPRLTQKTSA